MKYDRINSLEELGEVLQTLNDKFSEFNYGDEVYEFSVNDNTLNIYRCSTNNENWHTITNEELNEMLDSLIVKETISVSLGTIKAVCGWSKFCDETGGNHYMLKEWSVDNDEKFSIEKSKAISLGLWCD